MRHRHYGYEQGKKTRRKQIRKRKMYLHLGNNIVIHRREIIGIFDIENTSTGKITKDFLARAEKNKQVINVSYKMPKSYIVCIDENNNQIVYITNISSSTLKKRALGNEDSRVEYFEFKKKRNISLY